MCFPHVLMWVGILPSMPFYDLLLRVSQKNDRVKKHSSVMILRTIERR